MTELKTLIQTIYATAGTKCYNLSRVGMTEVSSLSISQEEADTRMFLHVQYALNHLQGNIIINSPDTDVFIISLMALEKINANINFKTGNKNKKIIISVKKIKESLKDKCDAVVSVGLECFKRALVSLNTFTGCDTVSVFAGLGKSKAFKIMAKNVDYIKLFEKLGKDWHLEEEIMRYIEGFACHLYGYSEMKERISICFDTGYSVQRRLSLCKTSILSVIIKTTLFTSKLPIENLERLYCR